jgi:hypothetical protein
VSGQSFWGDDGTRDIVAGWQLEPLHENESFLVKKIWGDPWRFSQWFDAREMKPLVW